MPSLDISSSLGVVGRRPHLDYASITQRHGGAFYILSSSGGRGYELAANHTYAAQGLTVGRCTSSRQADTDPSSKVRLVSRVGIMT